MSYDFYVWVNEGPLTVEEALSRCEEIADGPAGRPPSQVEDFVTALLGAAPMADLPGGWLMGDPWLTHLGAAVFSSWDNPMRNLYELLALAAPRGLAVLDVQQPRLYDPSGALDVEVTAGDGTRSPFLSPTLLRALLESLHPKYPYVIVERPAEHYVQTRRGPDDTFEVEHRAGSEERHYRMTAADVRTVEETLWQWATDDPRWRTLPWERVDV